MRKTRGASDPDAQATARAHCTAPPGPAPRIVCVGVAFQDMIFALDTLPQGQGKSRAHALHVSGGGMAANAAVAITRLGGRATFLGRVGDDAVGRSIIADLASEGVEVADMLVQSGALSPMSAILVDARGERQVVAYPGETLTRDAGWLVPALFAHAAVVLADVRWVEGAAQALRLARALHIPGVLDADLATHEALAALVPLADHAVFSEPGLQAYAPGVPVEAALRQALHVGARIAVVTLGERGLAYLAGEDAPLQTLAAYPVQAVETLGAGDVFHGAYALALAQGEPLETALDLASAAAACKCRKAGGRIGIPARQEVLALRR